MDEILRSSWGVMLAGSHWLLMLLAGLTLAAVVLVPRASWARERGLSLLEALVVLLLVAVVVLAVLVLT